MKTPAPANPSTRPISWRTAAKLLALIALLLSFYLLPSWLSARKPAGPIIFEDVTAESGVQFIHFDANRQSLLPEDVGSGASWADYDNDGDEDLYLVNFAGPLLTPPAALRQRPGNRLYRNNGDGSFTDVTAQTGVADPGWNNACLWFDYDGDGWLDLVVTHFQGVHLFRNQGDGSFSNATEPAGLSEIQSYLMGMTAADYDHDGDLDLYLCGYLAFDREAAKDRPLVAGRPAVWTNPVSYSAEPNLLLRNNGDGTFADVTAEAGVANPKGKSMHAVFCDFDNDGWPEIYVANDVSTADALFHNQRDGTFKEVSGFSGTHDLRAGMGLAVADVWHRGWMDLFVTHWVAEDHALWKNVSQSFRDKTPLSFDDLTPRIGLTPKPTALVGWGCGLYDFDNDAFPDLFLVNGSTIEDELTTEVLTNPKLLPQLAQIYHWDPAQEKFVELGAEAGRFFEEHHVSRGAAFADFDQDGRLDVVVLQHNEPAQLLRNVSPEQNWLRVKVAGDAPNHFGIGARVRLHAGGRTQSRDVLCGSSYLGNDSFIAHFGLGREQQRVDWIEVRFPDGSTRRKEDLPANELVLISK